MAPAADAHASEAALDDMIVVVELVMLFCRRFAEADVHNDSQW